MLPRRMGSLGPAAKQWSADPGHAAQTVHACGKLKSGNTCHGTFWPGTRQRRLDRGAVSLLIGGLVFFAIFARYFRLYIQSVTTGAGIGFFDHPFQAVIRGVER